jgi:transcriptional regulator with XRE-family HTH domain
MDYRKNFSSVLLALRKNNTLSLVALGDALGISNQAVSLLEKGKRSPSFEVLCALADYFNVSIDYLLGRTDKPEINK